MMWQKLCDPAWIPWNYYQTVDNESLRTNYKELLIDLLYLTPRPTKGILVPGALEAFDCNQHEAALFADRLLSALGYCRDKLKSMTSGKKVGKCTAVKEIIDVMNKVKNDTLGTDLVKKGKHLLLPGLKQSPEQVLEDSPPDAQPSQPSSSSKQPAQSPESQSSVAVPSTSATPPKACFGLNVHISVLLGQGSSLVLLVSFSHVSWLACLFTCLCVCLLGFVLCLFVCLFVIFVCLFVWLCVCLLPCLFCLLVCWSECLATWFLPFLPRYIVTVGRCIEALAL